MHHLLTVQIRSEQMEDRKGSGLELPGKEGACGVTSFKQDVCQWAIIMMTPVLGLGK